MVHHAGDDESHSFAIGGRVVRLQQAADALREVANKFLG